jgi:ATP-dependent RNA helicase RhlE
MLTGTVLWYDAKKGIGFIKPDTDENDVFVHMKALKAAGMKDLEEGVRVSFNLNTDTETGRKAGADFELLKGEAPRPRPKKKTPKEKAAEAKIIEDTPTSDASAFAKLGLDPLLVKSLSFLGYSIPTPIQVQAIPAALEGRDIVGLAQTGTGKTAAFALPILHRLLADPIERKGRSARVLILTPTRELAMQIHKNFRDMGKKLPLDFAVAIGGAPIRKQMQALSRGVDVLVATPGRLEDLVEQRALRLDQTTYVVLDEADQMMDIGFMPAIKRILPKLSDNLQTLLFSATMPKLIRELAENHLKDPVNVAVAPENTTAEKVTQKLMHLVKMNKGLALERIVKQNTGKRVLVFSRTKHGSDKLVKWLGTQDIKADAIHGNKSQGQRQRALEDFRKNKTAVLIATDIAARGIDIPGIEIVINYDLPNVPESYVHRIGRTARAGASGRAISFCAPDEQKQLRDIEKLIKKPIPLAHLEGLTAAVIPMEEKPEGRKSRARPNPNRKFGGDKSKGKAKPKGRKLKRA